MDVMQFLGGKPQTYAMVFLDVVETHRRGDNTAVANGIEVLLGYHVAAQDEPDTMRTLLKQLVVDAVAMEHITEMVAESYAHHEQDTGAE